MRKYAIVSFLDADYPQSFEHSDWPLHLTLLRPFATSLGERELIKTLDVICSQQKPVSTRCKSHELLGPNNDVPVIELEHTETLLALHENIKSVYQGKIEFIAPQFLTFRPHVTENKGQAVEIGAQLYLRTVSLVELNGGLRKVVYTWRLA